MNEHYKAVLADLEQMKADAEDGIRAIKRLMSRDVDQHKSAAVPPPVSEKTTKGRQSSDSSLPNKIIAFLEAHHGKSYAAQDIAEGLGGGVNMKTLRGTLARLAGERRIGKHGRGRYRSSRHAATTVTETIAA